MGHRWVDHTAEVELRLDGATEADVFASALTALAELLADESPAEAATIAVDVDAPDRAALLAAWLEELVFRAETEDFVPDGVEEIAFDDGRLRSRVRGHRGVPRHVVKAVTYHRLSFEAAGEGYRATMVLDV